MVTTVHPPPPDTTPPGTTPRRRLPRWVWALIALLTVITVVAVAVFATRGEREVVPSGDPEQPVTVAPSTSSPGTVMPASAADGCLGGATDLDRAVLTAQQQAPLTPEGAAAFTATLVRWASAVPASPYQQVTAQQVFSVHATSAAKKFLSSTATVPEASTGRVDFGDGGKYYVEAFDGDTAIVSYVATLSATQHGAPLGEAYVSGAVTLEAQNGTWHFRDQSLARNLEDVQRIGTPYAAGC
jgi:hypothetical protein